MLLCQEKLVFLAFFFLFLVLYMSEYLLSVTNRFSLQCCGLTSYFEFLRSKTLSCISRTLQGAEEHTRKKMPVSDASKTEESLGSGHEEPDILSTQEEMFPENDVTGNNRQAEQNVHPRDNYKHHTYLIFIDM